MSVRPCKNRRGELEPGKWIIDPYLGKGYPRRPLTFYGTEVEAWAVHNEMLRSAKPVLPALPKIRDLFDEWLQSYGNDHSPQTVHDAVKSFRHLLPRLGKVHGARLTPTMLEKYKTERIEEGVKPRTINKELSYLSSLLTWAVEMGYLNEKPCTIRRFGKIRSPRPRPLTQEEVTALLEHLEPHYRLPFLLLADAGLRRAEALTARRTDVDLEQGIIRIKGKGNKERVVPLLTDRLRAELRAAMARDNGSDYLLINPRTGRPYGSIRKAIIRAGGKAGLGQRVYHHLLRHSFGTNAVLAGMNLRAIQEIMGHSTITVTEGYTHLAIEHLKQEGRKFGRDVVPKTGKRPTVPAQPKKADIIDITELFSGTE